MVARPRTEDERFAEWRRQMVARQLRPRGITNEAVLSAMSRVPRHLFVPSASRGNAYEDSALQLEFEQTISQPYIVALMTELVRPEPGHRLLEIGTGSGYQAAVAAELVASVFSIEIIPELASSAAARLERLGVTNVFVRQGDGHLGWPEEAPFDGILVTAGADRIPEPLIDQLVVGGRMIIPVDDTRGGQTLKVIEKQTGGVQTREVIAVRFVPFVRE